MGLRGKPENPSLRLSPHSCLAVRERPSRRGLAMVARMLARRAVRRRGASPCSSLGFAGGWCLFSSRQRHKCQISTPLRRRKSWVDWQKDL